MAYMVKMNGKFAKCGRVFAINALREKKIDCCSCGFLYAFETKSLPAKSKEKEIFDECFLFEIGFGAHSKTKGSMYLSFKITLNSNVKVFCDDNDAQSMVSYFSLHAMNVGIL